MLGENIEMNRSTEMDIAKGIGIIFVVAGHLQILGHISGWVHMFYMSLFFMISGYFFRSKSISKSINNVLVPYFFFGILSSLVYYGFNHNASGFFSDLFSLICGGTAPFYRITPSSTLWFLSALFVMNIISSLLENIRGGEKNKSNSNICAMATWACL